MTIEQQYLQLLDTILTQGDDRGDRTGTGTRSIFGAMIRHDFSDGFPLLTTKRVYWKTAFREMLWMLSGGRNIQPLVRQGVSIWTDWPLKHYRTQTGEDISQEDFERRIRDDDAFANRWGDLGEGIYGMQWRNWLGSDGSVHDQWLNMIDQIQSNPSSRRIIMEGWNVATVEKAALPPCHKSYQVFVDSQDRLFIQMYQRSVDTFIGLAFNLANQALMAHILCDLTGKKPGGLIWHGGDVHLYKNHFDQAREQLRRSPQPLPQFHILNSRERVEDYTVEDFAISHYDPHPPIKAPVAV